MATVRFIRENGHPAIEIRAVDSTEEAFMQEFQETNVTAKWKAKLQYAYDGGRKLLFGWKSRVHLKADYIIEHYIKVSNADFDVTGYADIEEMGHYWCTKIHCPQYAFINGAVMRYKTDGPNNYTRAIFICSDSRKAYTLSQNLETREVIEFTFEPDLTVEKLKALEKKLGLY